MKKYLHRLYALIGLLLVMLALPAQAQYHGYRHHPQRHWHPNYGWVTPMIVGGVATYILTRPQPPVVVQEQPVIIERDTRTICSGWKEIQTPDGQVYRERSCRTVQE